MDINILLDKAKKMCGVEMEKDLAKRLGVSPQAVTNYRKGRALPDPVVCATLAGLTGEPLVKVIGLVGEARAISTEEKKVWRRLAATALGIVLLASSTLPFIATAKASERGAVYTLCEIQDGSPLLLVPAEAAAGTALAADKATPGNMEPFACL